MVGNGMVLGALFSNLGIHLPQSAFTDVQGSPMGPSVDSLIMAMETAAFHVPLIGSCTWHLCYSIDRLLARSLFEKKEKGS